MPVQLAPLAEAIGAEVHHVDLSAPLEDETFAAIEAAWNRDSPLLFRGPGFGPRHP